VATRAELRSSHGTPEEFERAIWEAHAQLFITTDEAAAAIGKYREEYLAAGEAPGRGIDALGLATLFHDTYERLAPGHGYATRPETRRFDADSPNGRLMIATCEVILAELARREVTHEAAQDQASDR
jgi:hypothetical protein